MGCLIPGTHQIIEAYPALLKIGRHEIPLPITGIVEGFTIEQDLERNCVWVYGMAKEGYYRLKVAACEKGFEILGTRGVVKKERTIVENVPFFLPPIWERLSLGSNKALDWDLVWRRMDLAEILPVIFGLGQKVPATGTLEEGKWDFDRFCRVAFKQILVPRASDDQHQGISQEEKNILAILPEAARKIRSLFFREEGRRLVLLGDCKFPAGRMTHVQAESVGEIDFEWTKKRLRRLCLRAKKSGEIFLDMPREIQSFRVRKSMQGRGKVQEASDLLFVEAGTTYYLDRFQV